MFRPMSKPLAALTILALLAGCGSSRLNPFNWFGSSREAARAELPAAPAAPQDPRPLIQQITQMVVEPIPSGAIVRATGLPPYQGWWDAQLVPTGEPRDGRLVFEFRVFPPVNRAETGLPQSREITAAAHVSRIKLENVREIVVQGELNARSARR